MDWNCTEAIQAKNGTIDTLGKISGQGANVMFG